MENLYFLIKILSFITYSFSRISKMILFLKNHKKVINNNSFQFLLQKDFLLLLLLLINIIIKAFSYLVPHPPEEHPNPLLVLPNPPLLSYPPRPSEVAPFVLTPFFSGRGKKQRINNQIILHIYCIFVFQYIQENIDKFLESIFYLKINFLSIKIY